MTVAERKPPGEARSADEAMEDYRQYRSRLNPVLAPLLVPDPENIYRWRVQYDCGCIEEQLATNDNVEWLLADSDHQLTLVVRGEPLRCSDPKGSPSFAARRDRVLLERSDPRGRGSSSPGALASVFPARKCQVG